MAVFRWHGLRQYDNHHQHDGQREKYLQQFHIFSIFFNFGAKVLRIYETAYDFIEK
jgi:hypothetical protein